MSENTEDKIMFQYVMNYKAYRIRMILFRGLITLLIAGALALFALKSVVLGIVLPMIALFLGVIAVIYGLGNERSYTVYADRVVLRTRGAYKRVTVPISAITRVSYRRAPYEKRFATGTVTLYARVGGRARKYRLWNIFDARPAIDYINERITPDKGISCE